jgi:hypothetical protein
MPQFDRMTLGSAAVLSLSTAARLLPVRDADARMWLRARGLVRHLEGREVVIWGDVLDALEDPKGKPPLVH